MTVYSTHKTERGESKLSFKKVGLIVFVFTTTIVVFLQVATWLNAQELFLLKQIRFEGHRMAAEEELRALIVVDSTRNLFDVDLQKIAGQIEQHPLVETALVRRGLPSRLIVEIVEKEPLALSNQTSLLPIDKSGQILKGFKSEILLDYPIVANTQDGQEDDLQKVLAFLQHSKQHCFRLYENISEISYSKKSGIYFYLCEQAIPVIAGKEQPEMNCEKLLKVLDKIKGSEQFSNIQYFDLRFDGRVVVKTS